MYALLSFEVTKSNVFMGIPCHARSFVLADDTEIGVLAPTDSDIGIAGPFSGVAGVLTQVELLAFFGENPMTFGFQDGTPFASSGSVWLSFENTLSVATKTDFTVSQGIGVALQLISEDTTDVSTSLTIAVHQALVKAGKHSAPPTFHFEPDHVSPPVNTCSLMVLTICIL